ncbi:MAG: hypothetical protein EHM24_17855 [Acidobacteria bacterium]|nr:MAG: hypothetical protein EHM24_17855 [Acidobacteriota bacterium]
MAAAKGKKPTRAKKKAGVHGWTRRERWRPTDQVLLRTRDNGRGVMVPAQPFVVGREASWDQHADKFIRINEAGFRALGVTPAFEATAHGAGVRLVPSGRTGAIPLLSGQTGHVRGGLVVEPRFGWTGIGRVLTETGWHASPEFLALPLVPGSGREVPPWVLAGPVLARLRELLRNVRRGYRDTEAVLRQPRGRILWPEYWRNSLRCGHWDRVPCRFPDLDLDPRIRRAVRWTLERLYADLIRVGGTDRISVELALVAVKLLEAVADVRPEMPRRASLGAAVGHDALLDVVIRRGLEAMAWVVEERGLGGGREQDGLSWQLPLDRLWEGYVEGVIRREAAVTGGEVRVGRLNETLVPLHWTDPVHRSLGHLLPDIVVHHRASAAGGRAIQVVDAKYKAHLAELDEVGWREFIDEQREAHRADIHQVLAYAGGFDASEVRATLVYPLRRGTWEHLHARGHDVSSADLYSGGRHVRLELRGIPFGGVG